MATVGSQPVREAILDAARRTLGDDPGASIATVVARAGVSRATFYRHFHSRAELLDALDIEPDPGARARILSAAVELLARDGLARLSMDELAEAAGVSRASVYRLFPGKSALFAELLATYSPFEEFSAVLERMADRPPDEVLPQLLHVAARVGHQRIGILRSLMFEISSGTPDAVEAARHVIRPLLGEVSAYIARQMSVGRVRPMHPILAAQALMGPLVFHLVTRSFAVPLVGLDIGPDEAADEFARVALGGLLAESPPA